MGNSGDAKYKRMSLYLSVELEIDYRGNKTFSTHVVRHTQNDSYLVISKIFSRWSFKY